MDRVLTDKEMCGVKFDKNFRGDPQLLIDDGSRKFMYVRGGSATEEYLGYSDPLGQRPHSRFWGMTRKEMYALLWKEHRKRIARKGIC